jgi:hypothetical protein
VLGLLCVGCVIFLIFFLTLAEVYVALGLYDLSYALLVYGDRG